MLPNEVQSILAKILFFLFAICMLCLGKLRAEEMGRPLSLLGGSQSSQVIQKIL